MMPLKSIALAGLALVLALPWSSNAASAAPPNNDEALRHRARDFNQALWKGDYDTAVKFVDPEIVEAVSKATLRENFGKLMDAINGINAALQRKITNCRVHKVTLDKDKAQAAVVVMISSSDKFGGGTSNNFLPPQIWVLKKNIWYFFK